MRVRIRRASVGDARGIAFIHVISWRTAYTGILPERFLGTLEDDSLEKRWRGRLSKKSSDERIWVVEVEDAIVGFASAGPCLGDEDVAGLAGEVSMLYLHPRAIGHGLGAHLFGRALERLAEDGWRWLVVWVLAENREGRRFYARMGLRPDDATRIDWFGRTPVRVVRYACALNPVVDFAAIARSPETSR